MFLAMLFLNKVLFGPEKYPFFGGQLYNIVQAHTTSNHVATPHSFRQEGQAFSK